MILTAMAPLAEPAGGPGPAPTPSSRQGANPVPDLVVSNISLSDDRPMDGATVSVFAKVDNIGTGTAKDFAMAIYAAGKLVTMAQVITLAPGNSTTAAGMVKVRSGYLDIEAIADPQGKVTEVSKANDMLVRTIWVQAPDLTVTGVSYVPLNYTDGDKVTITATVKNMGADTITGFSCSLSVDQTVLTTKGFSGLMGGDSIIMVTEWIATAGPHDIVARADTSDVLLETNRSNDVMILPLSSGYPDLHVDSITTQPALGKFVDGDTVIVRSRVRNAGQTTHSNIQARFLVDGVVKGTMTVNGLERNGTRDLAFQWVALGGKHDLRADVDAGGHIVQSNSGNRFALLAVDLPMADLAIDDLQLTPVMPVDGSLVKASALVRNKGTGATNQTVPVHFLANGDDLGSASITKGLKANATAYANFSFAAHAGKTVVAAIAGPDHNIPEVGYSNNGAFKLLDVPYPDIYLTNLTVSPNATSLVDGGTGNIMVTARNKGPGNTTASFSVDLYLDGKLLESMSVKGLPIGVPKVLSADFTVVGGTHYISARADPIGNINEANETNNVVQAPVTIGLPDIRVQDLFWAPNNPSPGQAVRLTVVLKNVGRPTKRDIWVQFMVNATTVAQTLVPGSTLVGTVNAQADYLATGHEGTMEVSVDMDHMVPEANRTDDRLARTFPSGNLVPRGPGPDLVITDLSWLPAKVSDAEEVSFIATLRNRGAVPDPGSDGSKALQPSVTILVDNEKVSASSVKMLSTDGVVVVPWTAMPGTHKVTAVVDWELVIDEDNETNNAIMKDLSVGQADLTLSDLKVMDKGAEDGNGISLFVKVTDLGNRTLRPIQLQYLIDGVQAGTENVDGASMNMTTTVLHIWTAVPGKHTVLIFVDLHGTTVETNERNNLITGNISVDAPDLVLASLQVQAQVDDGSSSIIVAKVMNTGKGDTVRHFDLRFYVDGDIIGSATLNGLRAGGDVMVSQSLVPGPGKHTIRAIVDPEGQVMESSMANNDRSRPGLNVTLTDLAVKSIMIGPRDDRSALIFATITNKGNTTARAVDVDLYANDVLIASGTLEGLSGGHNTTIAKKVTIGPGNQRIKVVVDPDRRLSEGNLSNDQLVLIAPFQPYPNLYVDEVDVGGPMVQGGDVQVTAKIRALGADVHIPFFVSLYIDGNLMGSTHVSGVPMGEVAMAMFSAKASVGQHHLRVQVDQENAVLESNEMDNAQVTTFTVSPPDLQVVEIRSYTETNDIAVFARVRNNASALLAPFSVSFYADGTLVRSVQVDGLPSMSSTQVMATVPQSTSIVRVVVNEDGSIPEKDMTNDVMSAGLNPASLEGALDLTVADVVLVPQFPVDGEWTTLFVIVDNEGDRALLRSTDVDVLINNRSVAKLAVAGIPDGGTVVLGCQWAATAGMGINLTARVDTGGVLSDAVRSNNNFTTLLNVSMPEVKVLNVSYPQGYFGEVRTLFVKLGNVGDGATLRHYSVQVLVEGDQVAVGTVDGLPARTNTTVALDVARSWGEKELLIRVGSVTGSILYLTNLSLGWPDIRVTDVWTEKRANASMTTAFTEVRNGGYGIGTAFSVRMYVNGKDLGPVDLEGLQSNGTVVLAWSFKTTDIYEISALADVANKVAESNELNNYLEKNLTTFEGYVPPDVDLALSSFNITQYGGETNLYKLDALVENLGTSVSGSKVRFLVDGTLLQEVLMDPMKDNATRKVTVYYSGPMDRHVFKATVDSGRAIAELDETHNEHRTVYAANFPPTPFPGNNQTITVGGKAKLLARGSDPDGRIVRYEWDFDGDGRYDWSSNESKTVWHTYYHVPPHGAKFYNATLRVTDDRGAMTTATVYIKVVEKQPWPSIPAADRTRVISFVLGLTCIMAGLVILYLFMKASRPLKKSKAELKRERQLEKEGVRRSWPPWKREVKEEEEDEREAEPEVEIEKEAKQPEYPEDAPATIQEIVPEAPPEGTPPPVAEDKEN